MLAYAISGIGWMLFSFKFPRFENIFFTCWKVYVTLVLYSIYSVYKKEKLNLSLYNNKHLPIVSVWNDDESSNTSRKIILSQ